MRARLSLVALGSLILFAPLGSLAQEKGKVWRIGVLVGRGRADDPLIELLPALRERGYVEGRNLVVESRFAEGDYGRLPELAAELVRLRPDVIFAADGTATATAAKKATTTIPIVFAFAGDPVGTGLVQSLSHPGGNITGVSNRASTMHAKNMETLSAVVPGLARVAVLINPANANSAVTLESLRNAGQKTGVTVSPMPVRSPEQIEDAFSRMRQQRPDAVVVAGDSLLTQQRFQVAGLCAKLFLPSAGMFRSYAEAGGLFSYGANVADTYRRAAAWVDRIFKGAMPSDLPVEQATKFELVINRKTAKALGMTIPPELLVLADKVIE